VGRRHGWLYQWRLYHQTLLLSCELLSGCARGHLAKNWLRKSVWDIAAVLFFRKLDVVPRDCEASPATASSPPRHLCSLFNECRPETFLPAALHKSLLPATCLAEYRRVTLSDRLASNRSVITKAVIHRAQTGERLRVHRLCDQNSLEH
jgi:hypothetical protein